MDFVLGQRIQLSADHPKKDICDKLAGDYPKDFVFDGWHPQCFCHVTPITIPPEETKHLTDMFLNGEDWKGELKRLAKGREITSYPENFKSWVRDNADNIKAARARGTAPYFIENNQGAIDRILNPGAEKTLTPLEKAKLRHSQRTPEQEEEIRLRWKERQERIAAEKAKNAKEESKSSQRITEIIAELPDTLTNTEKKAIAEHNLKLEKALGITKGKPMSVDDADKQHANPNLGKKKGFGINCQTCAPAYALRLMGFNITAKSNTPGTKLDYLSRGNHLWESWLNLDGTPAKHTSLNTWMANKGYQIMTEKRYLEFFNEICKDIGVYMLSIGWESGGGHATILQRFADGELRYIEPQRDNSTDPKRNLYYLCRNGATTNHGCRGIMRIDNKLFNISFIEIFDKGV